MVSSTRSTKFLRKLSQFFAIDLLDALFVDTYVLKYHVFLDVITLDEFAEGT
jgi:hypothetical protein